MCALLYQQISREKALRPRFPSGSAEDALQGRGNRREQTCERHSVMGFSRPRREQWASPWMRAPAFPCVWWKPSCPILFRPWTHTWISKRLSARFFSYHPAWPTARLRRLFAAPWILQAWSSPFTWHRRLNAALMHLCRAVFTTTPDIGRNGRNRLLCSEIGRAHV